MCSCERVVAPCAFSSTRYRCVVRSRDEMWSCDMMSRWLVVMVVEHCRATLREMGLLSHVLEHGGKIY